MGVKASAVCLLGMLSSRAGRPAGKEGQAVQKLPDNAEHSYKCVRCGHVFAAEGEKQAACPQCGFVCSPQSCRVIGASNEGY